METDFRANIIASKVTTSIVVVLFLFSTITGNKDSDAKTLVLYRMMKFETLANKFNKNFSNLHRLPTQY